MEEKKQRGFLFSKGMKILTAVVLLLSIGVFTAGASILSGLFGNGLRWEDIGQNGQMVYEETSQCGAKVAQFVSRISEAAKFGGPFISDGRLDLEKTVDITNLGAGKKEQDKNTTYTVESLRELLYSGDIDQIRDGLYQAENGYYGAAADTSESGEAEIENEFSSQFQYLFTVGQELENELPLSGKKLAEYASENTEDVSLLDLYKNLVDAGEQLNNYLSVQSHLDGETNVMYLVKNTDTNEIFTNVPSWEKGYNSAAFGDISPVFSFEAVREKGNLKVEADDTDARHYVKNYFKDFYLTGQNEEVKIFLNADYPVIDEFYQASQYYWKYAKAGRLLLIMMLISLVMGMLSFILVTVQAGRDRNQEGLKLRAVDRMPTEVILAAGIIALSVMLGFGYSFYAEGYIMEIISMVMSVLAEMGLGVIFLAAYLSFIRRVKGKLVWNSSLCHAIVKSCKNVYMARKTSGRMITAFLVLVLGNMLAILVFGGMGFLLALLADGLVLLYLVREGAGRQVIRDGLARIASGELDFKIDERELTGDNREMAEAVNHVGDGLQNAVKETLKSERLKADLITNVSHDIKTPLTSIINYVDLLKREDIQNPKIKGYIDILDSKSQRLKQLTEDLVEASKISSGNVVLDMNPIQFGELVWQTNGEFEEKFASRDLELVCRIPEEPVYIMADGRRMWRVVENLYNNVAKYAMPKTRVYVEVKKLGCRVVFEIKNVSANPLNNIRAEELTERFIRGDVSRSTEGSGLGLSIAQNLVKLQKGTFDIYLDGDLFKVTITFEAAAKAARNMDQ